MKKIEAIKDGTGNIIISENSFKTLLAYLDIQKNVHETRHGRYVGEEQYKSAQQDTQNTIDEYSTACKKILHQKYVLETNNDEYWLSKRYEHQKELTPWSNKDISVVNELFKDTRIKWEKPENLRPIPEGAITMSGTNPIGMDENDFFVCEPEPTPWLIEAPMRRNGEYLTISEDGKINRPWEFNEIERVGWALNSSNGKYDGKGESRNK